MQYHFLKKLIFYSFFHLIYHKKTVLTFLSPFIIRIHSIFCTEICAKFFCWRQIIWKTITLILPAFAEVKKVFLQWQGFLCNLGVRYTTVPPLLQEAPSSLRLICLISAERQPIEREKNSSFKNCNM